MNPANLDRVIKVVLAVISAGGLALKKWLDRNSNNNNGE